MKVRRIYAIAALLLFAVEVLIALFVRDVFVRSYIGDVLAVMLVYSALRTMTPLGATTAIAVTLAIAAAIEIAQALNVLGALGLGDNQIARTVFGGVFDWLDIAAYLVGAAAVLALERMFRRGGRSSAI